MDEQQVKNKLQAEMARVSFSAKQIKQLELQLLQTVPQSPRSSIREQFAKLWNGSMEIPLPLAVVTCAALLLVAGNSLVNIYVVDSSTAMAILEARRGSMQSITQGVSVI